MIHQAGKGRENLKDEREVVTCGSGGFFLAWDYQCRRKEALTEWGEGREEG